MLVPPELAVLMLVVPGIFASLSAAYPLRKEAPWRPLGLYLLWAPAGILVGVLALDGFPAWGLKIFLAVLLVHTLVGKRAPRALDVLRWAPVSGTIAGIAAGALGTAGPPVVAWAHAQEEWSLDRKRAATLWIFSVLTPLRLPFYLAFGMLGDERIWIVAAIALPTILAGSATGTWVSRRLPERAAHITLRVAIGALAITMLVGGILDI